MPGRGGFEKDRKIRFCCQLDTEDVGRKEFFSNSLVNLTH